MTAKLVAKCWICGDVGTTGEHRTKRSDLRLALGNPTQANPAYFHDAKRANQLVRSLDAEVLKSPSRICAKCNNARTQPHDKAWEKMSEHLRSRQPPLKPGDVVRGNRIFPYDTKRHMLCVQLYFLKLFGCMICESGRPIPIDVASFASAIQSGSAHPNVYLKLGKGDRNGVGGSNLEVLSSADLQRIFACWIGRAHV